MENLKKSFLIFCSIALMFPSLVSLAHIPAHQDEVACTNLSDTHYHKKSLDCELCDFRLANVITFSPVAFTPITPEIPRLKFFDSYQFLSDYQKLHFELRGPPALA